MAQISNFFDIERQSGNYDLCKTKLPQVKALLQINGPSEKKEYIGSYVDETRRTIEKKAIKNTNAQTKEPKTKAK